MRGYLTFHKSPEAVKYYFPRSARILTGTIFVRNADRAYDRFAGYSRQVEDSFFHITLSLPTSMTLSPPRWRDEIREHLRARGANPAHLRRAADSARYVTTNDGPRPEGFSAPPWRRGPCAEHAAHPPA